MVKRQPILGYIPRKSFMHSLNGSTKLIMMVMASVTAMLGFDTRLLAAMTVVSIIIWVVSRIRMRDLALVLWIIFILMLLNNIFIFLFAPTYGTEIYGSSTVLFKIWGPYVVTSQQLFYQLNVTLKYFAVLPTALLFIVTTAPSEFASSLNRIGVPYKVAYSVSLALRYIPNVQREYREIRQAQAARGVDTSKDVSLGKRMRNSANIVMPMLLVSFDKIETISTAMELRGFGKNKKRTWYTVRAWGWRDWLAILISTVFLGVSIALLWVNGGRFYNPFI